MSSRLATGASGKPSGALVTSQVHQPTPSPKSDGNRCRHQLLSAIGACGQYTAPTAKDGNKEIINGGFSVIIWMSLYESMSVREGDLKKLVSFRNKS